MNAGSRGVGQGSGSPTPACLRGGMGAGRLKEPPVAPGAAPALPCLQGSGGRGSGGPGVRGGDAATGTQTLAREVRGAAASRGAGEGGPVPLRLLPAGRRPRGCPPPAPAAAHAGASQTPHVVDTLGSPPSPGVPLPLLCPQIQHRPELWVPAPSGGPCAPRPCPLPASLRPQILHGSVPPCPPRPSPGVPAPPDPAPPGVSAPHPGSAPSRSAGVLWGAPHPLWGAAPPPPWGAPAWACLVYLIFFFPFRGEGKGESWQRRALGPSQARRGRARAALGSSATEEENTPKPPAPSPAPRGRTGAPALPPAAVTGTPQRWRGGSGVQDPPSVSLLDPLHHHASGWGN